MNRSLRRTLSLALTFALAFALAFTVYASPASAAGKRLGPQPCAVGYSLKWMDGIVPYCDGRAIGKPSYWL